MRFQYNTDNQLSQESIEYDMTGQIFITLIIPKNIL